VKLAAPQVGGTYFATLMGWQSRFGRQGRRAYHCPSCVSPVLMRLPTVRYSRRRRTRPDLLTVAQWNGCSGSGYATLTSHPAASVDSHEPGQAPCDPATDPGTQGPGGRPRTVDSCRPHRTTRR
jgi:hypothetical protein